MPDHALLSASSSHRWMMCPPSARLCENVPDTPSEFAQQGTDAHELAAYKVLRYLGREASKPEAQDSEMGEHTDAYLEFVIEQIASCHAPQVLVEQRLDFSRWVPSGFGTGDCCIVSDDAVHVIDFKYGMGVLVEAAWNTQMMCYALGLIDEFDWLYSFDRIRMSIFQPRRANVDTFELSKAELLDWADNVLAPTAKLAYAGEGEFKAGDHCRFCRVKATCRARAEYSLAMDFKSPALLTDEEIAEVLPKLDTVASWVGDVQDYALKQALSGTRYAGFKLVEGRSNTRYSSDEAVAAAVERAGYNPYETKVLGITAMKQLLGKQFDDILRGLLVKPAGKPTLVPVTDKRKEINHV